MPLNHNRFHELAKQCWAAKDQTGYFDYVRFGQLVVAECVMYTNQLDNPCAALLLQQQIYQPFEIAEATPLEEQMHLECEDRLLALLGSLHLVERWWHTPNREFGMVNPWQVWLEQPQQVLDYLRRF